MTTADYRKDMDAMFPDSPFLHVRDVAAWEGIAYQAALTMFHNDDLKVIKPVRGCREYKVHKNEYIRWRYKTKEEKKNV